MTDYSKRRCEKASAPEDRLTALHDDLLISILSFLPIKQRVALSAVCTRFLGLLPSIPRLDTFRLDVRNPSGGVDVHQDFTFPRALIHQCHIVFCGGASELSKPPHEQLLVKGLVESGVQDLILKQASGMGSFYVIGRENCGFFGIKSLRSLFLDNIRVSEHDDDRRPLSPLRCAFLTSLKMRFSVFDDTFLRNLLASCPFLETLQIIRCFTLGNGTDELRFHSASIKHLFWIQLQINMHRSTSTVDIRAPQLEWLVVDVVTTLRIEAPKVRNASFLLSIERPADPPGALMKLLYRASFPRQAAWLMLTSSKSPNILAADDKYDLLKYKESVVIFKLDFNLKDQSSTTILTKLLKKCNGRKTKFDIRTADSTRIESSTETARRDKQLLHGPTGLELINLQMTMPETIFQEFISNPEKMKKFKDTGLKMLRRRTSKEQFKDILASQESLFRVSSSIANCLEMNF